jgi:Contact-dependent growth inhibition CdiA C-terminal domain
VTGLRIDGKNAVIPPSRPTVMYRRRIHPKRALAIGITANLFPARPYETANFGSLMTARAAVERPEWQTLLSRGDVDRCGSGVIDERGKRFSPRSAATAEYFARHGPAVVSVSEGYGVYGRTPDARVNDIPVEFKSLDPGASDRTVKAALNSAKGQARLAVIDARGSRLAEDVANRGIRRFSGTPHG